MARSTYFDLGRSADACPGSESGYAQRFQCGNIVKRRIWTRMVGNAVVRDGLADHEWCSDSRYYVRSASEAKSTESPGPRRVSPIRFCPSENGKLSAFRGVSNEYRRTWYLPSASEAESHER